MKNLSFESKFGLGIFGAFFVSPFILFVAIPLFLAGCKSPPDRIAYNTIGSLDSLAKATYTGYSDYVIAAVQKGDWSKTNNLPDVSAKYNQIEGGLLIAATVASQGTNSISPADLTSNVLSFVSYIGTLTKK